MQGQTGADGVASATATRFRRIRSTATDKKGMPLARLDNVVGRSAGDADGPVQTYKSLTD